MKPSINAALALAALGLAGCVSSSTSVASRQPFVKPGLIMLTADQAARHGINLASLANDTPMPKELQPLDTAAVVTPAGVKVYTLNRSVDPTDPDILHEEHVIYRRETTPQWRLDAPAGQKILVGPRVTDGRQDIQPLLTKELTTFLADQSRATEANQKAITALFQAIDAMNRQQQAIIRRNLGKSAKAETPAPSEKTSPTPEEPTSSDGATEDKR